MPFWKRSKVDSAQAEKLDAMAQLSEMPARLEGTGVCSVAGCGRATGIACQYVDRRNRSCKSAWCPVHRIVVNGQILCRRHASLLTASIDGEMLLGELPDFENRAPSLVRWVAQDLDADIRGILLRESELSTGAQLIVDPVYLSFVGSDHRRVWERTWKLATHTGLAVRVGLQVDEAADSEVIVKVGARIVDRAVPPWITLRPEAGAVDTGQRSEFNRRLLDAISQAVEYERELARRLALRETLRRMNSLGNG